MRGITETCESNVEGPVAAPSESPTLWQGSWTRWWPWVLIGLQALIYGGISWHRWDTFQMSHDFAAYWQAVQRIGETRNANPWDSVFGYRALANNGEVLLDGLGWFVYPWCPHPWMLLGIQDAALVGTSLIAKAWMQTLFREAIRVHPDWSLAQANGWATGALAVIVSNPWWMITVGFDFHPESILACSILGASYALYRRRLGALLGWSALTLSGGSIGILLLLGLGMAAAVQRRGVWALGLLGSASLAFWALARWHWDQGSVLVGSYGYLWAPRVLRHPTAFTVGWSVLTHPGRAWHTLQGRTGHIFDNLWPGGIVMPWPALGIILPSLVLLGVNSLTRLHVITAFGSPGFQNAPIYALLTIGAVHTLFFRRWPGGRWPRRSILGHPLGIVLGVSFLLMIVGAGGMAAEQLLTVTPWSPAIEQVLHHVEAQTPEHDEVITSQAVTGRFASRRWVYAVMQTQHFPLHTPWTVVVLIPRGGAHLLPVSAVDQEIATLRKRPAVHVIVHRPGIWVFRVPYQPGGLALPYHLAAPITPID